MKREVLIKGFLSVEKDQENGHLVVVSTDSVGILMYDLVSEKVILTVQSRSPMKGITGDDGTLTEVPAGRFDRDLGVIGLVIEEVKEETGISISGSDVAILNNGMPLALCPGTNTERMFLTAVEVDLSAVYQDDEVYGKEEEGERIKRLVISFSDFLSMNFQDMKTWALAQYLKSVLAKRPKFLRQ
jgi:8-oxo-dGTP pyrophosphatase MutT (NUDIX family)